MSSLADDPVQKVLWQDRHAVRLNGGRAHLEEQNGVIYLAIGLRNVGAGIVSYIGREKLSGQILGARTGTLRRYSLERYVSRFNAMATEAELGIRKGGSR